MAAQWQHVSGANSINQLYPVMFQASYVPHSRAVAAVESHYATHTLNVHSTRFTGPCSMHTVRGTNCSLHSLHPLHLCTQQSHIADAYWSPFCDYDVCMAPQGDPGSTWDLTNRSLVISLVCMNSLNRTSCLLGPQDIKYID